MIKDFEVIVSELSSTVSEKGFGTILILDHEKARDYTIIGADDIETLGKTSKANKLATRLFQQNPKPQEVAVVGVADGTAETLVSKLLEVSSKNWFWLVCTDNTPATVKAIAEKIATMDKFYMATFSEIENKDESGNFVARFIEEIKFKNVANGYHDQGDAYLAEALAVPMSYEVGNKTGKFTELQGMPTVAITDGNLKYLHDNGAFTYITKMGADQTSEGLASDGSYIDETLANMWIKARIEEGLMNLALSLGKIPYTNTGISLMVGVVRSVMTEAIGRGIVSDDAEPIISYRKREDVPTSDVAKRDYSYIEVVYVLTGAIHTGKIHAKPTRAIVRY